MQDEYEPESQSPQKTEHEKKEPRPHNQGHTR